MAAKKKPQTKSKRKSGKQKPSMVITAERGGPPVLSPLERSEVGVLRIRRAIKKAAKAL